MVSQVRIKQNVNHVPENFLNGFISILPNVLTALRLEESSVVNVHAIIS